MKTIRLIFSLSLVLLCVFEVSAQRHNYGHRKQKPTIYMVEFEQIDTISCPMKQAIAHNNFVAQSVRDDFAATLREGFQQTHNPQFIFATKNNRFALGIGGEIMLRTSYDMKGAVDNIDFIRYTDECNVCKSPADYDGRQHIAYLHKGGDKLTGFGPRGCLYGYGFSRWRGV